MLRPSSSSGTHKSHMPGCTAATRIPVMAKRAIPSITNAPAMQTMLESSHRTGVFLNMGLFSICMGIMRCLFDEALMGVSVDFFYHRISGSVQNIVSRNILSGISSKTHLNIQISVQDRGGVLFQTADISSILRI